MIGNVRGLLTRKSKQLLQIQHSGFVHEFLSEILIEQNVVVRLGLQGVRHGVFAQHHSQRFNLPKLSVSTRRFIEIAQQDNVIFHIAQIGLQP